MEEDKPEKKKESVCKEGHNKLLSFVKSLFDKMLRDENNNNGLILFVKDYLFKGSVELGSNEVLYRDKNNKTFIVRFEEKDGGHKVQITINNRDIGHVIGYGNSINHCDFVQKFRAGIQKERTDEEKLMEDICLANDDIIHIKKSYIGKGIKRKSNIKAIIDILVLVFAVISIIIVSLFHFPSISSWINMKLGVGLVWDKDDSLIYTLCLSFFSASVFYGLTIYLPERYRRNSIRKYLKENLRLLMNFYDEKLGDDYGEIWANDLKFPLKFYKKHIVGEEESADAKEEKNENRDVTNTAIAIESNEDRVKRYLYELVTGAESRIQLILAHADLISVPNQNLLLEILMSHSFTKIKSFYNLNNREILKDNDWIIILVDLQDNYERLKLIKF